MERTVIRKVASKLGTKSGIQMVSGIVLIVLTFILNGFLSFMECGFDLSALATSHYWANFCRMTVSEIIEMFGMYLIQKTKDLANSKITGLKSEIETKRTAIYGVEKVAEAEEWLRVVYNYREKLILYDTKLKSLYEKITCVEPTKDESNYDKKMLKYQKNLAKKEFLKQQMAFVNKDFERLKLIVNKAPKEEVDKISEELNTDEYLFKTAKLKYRNVYWSDLLGGENTNRNRRASVFFNEGKELSKNTIAMIGWGCIASAYIATMVFPAFNGWSVSYIINLIISAVCLLWFMTRGVMLSKKIILGDYVNALEKRKAVYSMMLVDLGIKIQVKGEENERCEIGKTEQTNR